MRSGGWATSKIFISYRREDSAAYAGRLCDHLARLFGAYSVFMDVEDISPGQNFAQAIEAWINDCSAVLVVIGPKWFDCLGQRSRGAQPDYVAREIIEALARKIPVIPVLVAGANINELAALPPALADLSFHQAVELRDPTFHEDVDRLAKSLNLTKAEAQAASVTRPVFNTPAKWAGALAAVVLLLLVVNGLGFGPWHAYRQRKIDVDQLLRTAQTQMGQEQYESAFKTYQEAAQLDPGNAVPKNRQVDAAMLWVENFHVVAQDQKSGDVAAPPLAQIRFVLEAALARTDGHDSRAADILAHLGWTHWLNEHIASQEFGPAAEQGMRQALSVEPNNVYGNAMLGNWLMQKHGDFNEAVQHFEAAVKTGWQRPLVRQFQLAGLLSYDDLRARMELTKLANQMRLKSEPISDQYRSRLLRNYDPSSGFRNGALMKTLSSVASDQSWATFLWLDSKPLQGDNPELKAMLRAFVHACLAEIDGNHKEALALFKSLQRELKVKNYSGSLSDAVDFFLRTI